MEDFDELKRCLVYAKENFVHFPHTANAARVAEIEDKIVEYVRGLESEVARLREERRWIPVSERLPEDVCGGASTYVEVVYANFDEETGEIGSQYYRKITQYWHKYSLWEYEYNRGPKSFEEYGYKIIFWKYRTPIPEPPEAE